MGRPKKIKVEDIKDIAPKALVAHKIISGETFTNETMNPKTSTELRLEALEANVKALQEELANRPR